MTEERALIARLRLRLWLTIGAVILSVVAAGVIASQLPAALARSEHAADMTRLNSQLVGLTDRTNAVSLDEEHIRTTIDSVSAQNGILALKLAKQRADINSLKKDIERLKNRPASSS